jgi:hypothetical protein
MMVRREQGTALRQVQMLFQVGTIGSLSDRQLLEQFHSRAADAAEAAFAGLVERHGPMVIRACRSVLQDEHAVEDAFQDRVLCWPHSCRRKAPKPPFPLPWQARRFAWRRTLR